MFRDCFHVPDTTCGQAQITLMQDSLKRDLVLEALNMALGRRLPCSGLMHHSDRGSQYASQDFQNLLKANGITCSMSGTGDCYDNAVAESFFATLKRERVHRCRYQTRAKARVDALHYIEIFYNGQRRHAIMGYKSPVQFEAAALKGKIL